APDARRPPTRAGRGPLVTSGPALRGAREGDARGRVAAVAVRVLVEVLLVVVLGVVERAGLGGGSHLGRDRVVALGLEHRAVALGGLADRPLLLRRRPVHGRPVLRADVVALAEALRRVVALPEDLEELLLGDLRGVVRDERRLGVPRARGARLLVGGVRRRAAHVADGGAHHTGDLPEDLLGAPETAHREVEHARALGPRARDGRAEHGVRARVLQDRGLAPGEGVLGGDHRRLAGRAEDRVEDRVHRLPPEGAGTTGALAHDASSWHGVERSRGARCSGPRRVLAAGSHGTIESMYPPSTRTAAPVVAEARGDAR